MKLYTPYFEMAKNVAGSYSFHGKITVIENNKKFLIPVEASIDKTKYGWSLNIQGNYETYLLGSSEYRTKNDALKFLKKCFTKDEVIFIYENGNWQAYVKGFYGYDEVMNGVK